MPAPRATNGTPAARQARTAAATWAVDVGSTTACGIARWLASPSVSYGAERGVRRDHVVGPNRAREIGQEAHPREPTRGAILHG